MRKGKEIVTSDERKREKNYETLQQLRKETTAQSCSRPSESWNNLRVSLEDN
jgi:hypothetical protein